MRIAYFTTAQENDEFKKFYLDRKIDVNSSNQVFHNNLIECLSKDNEVTVFCCRSDSNRENSTKVKQGKVTWHYLATKKSSLSNLRSQRSEVSKVTKYVDLVFVDTTNARCLLAAKDFCKIKHVPLVGVVTDNPANITGLNFFAARIIKKEIKKLNAYICVTEELNSLVNVENKPNLIIKGLVADIKPCKEKPVVYDYFFYAGSLMKKYGIYDLIDAFNSIKKSRITKLVIAGHHEEPGFQDYIKDNCKIVYLGNIPNSEVVNYEEYSIANVNPRPFDPEIDKYSVPSKFVEYTARNSMIVSGMCTSLKPDFRTNVLWIEGKKTLANKLTEAIEIGKIAKTKAIKEMNLTSEKRFGIISNSKKINKFILTIKK